MSILVVEDDELMRDFVGQCLEQNGFDVTLIATGSQGREHALSQDHDLAVLDISLPEVSGTEICQHMRQQGVTTPVLFLTAHDSIKDKVSGLEAGADDYLVKPFEYPELIARVKALLRRSKGAVSDTMIHGALEVNIDTHKATIAGHELLLTPKEFKLLETMIRHPEKVHTRQELLDAIWGIAPGSASNRLEVCVTNLRTKIRATKTPDPIATEYGIGYRLKKTS